MRKFEYKTLVIDTEIKDAEAMEKMLNELGENGWEIISIMANDDKASTVFFKKEKPREFEEREPRKPFSGDRANKRPFDSKPRSFDSKPRGEGFGAKAADMRPRKDDKPWVNNSKSDRRPKRF